jgi:class 3 adenylate cyclase/tetratricopeptide (TPR) repeat protein
VRIEPGSTFCNACGGALPGPAGAVLPTPVRFPSPATYNPEYLADRITPSKAALEGERKLVTVLFADMKGSMELLAERDPEDARRILEPVLQRMMDAVHRYEGTVNQVMGDGIMSLFGAPLANEDHAVRACYAALQMQQTVQGYAAEVQREEGVPIQIRVGLNSGEVVVGAIGSDLRMEYTAIGQTTHLAARMEQMALPGSILLTAETLRLAEGFVEVKPLGPIRVKGLSEPVETFEAIGAGPVRTRLQAVSARGLNPFVGRQAELDHLHRAFDLAGAGHSQIVAIVGEPGVGKSRLVLEAIQARRTEGWLILHASSVSYGKATPYLPVIELLKEYFEIEARDDSRRIREKVVGKPFTFDGALEKGLPALLSLLDVPVEDVGWRDLDPPQRRQQTLEAVKGLLLREGQVHPLLLVFEDLHWIDTETQALLDSLVESLSTARLLLLVNYRPEYEHGWDAKGIYSQLRLDPLPPETASVLLHGLVGDDRSLQPLTRTIIERGEGNPFFLEESVRILVDTHVLVGARGAYRVAKPLQDVQIPATIEAVLTARIDRLPTEAKRLLQVAAVIGKDVPLPLLESIAELSNDELGRSLSRLQAAELLYELNLFPYVEYAFTHALTYEVTYRSLLHERRRALHAKVVAAIEELGAARVGEQIERLAQHAFQAGVWDKAATYCRQAGRKASGRSAYREAIGCFKQALEAQGHLPRTRARLEQTVDTEFDLRHALVPLGETSRVIECLKEAEALAADLEDPDRRGWVAAYLGRELSLTGAHHEALESARRAITIAGDVGDVGLGVVATNYAALAESAIGDYSPAITRLKECVAQLDAGQVRERFGQPTVASVVSHAILMLALGERGEFADALRYGAEALRTAEAVDHRWSLVLAYRAIGELHLSKGDASESTVPLERALYLSEVANIPQTVPSLASALGYAYVLLGRLYEAAPLLEQGAGAVPSMMATRTPSRYLAWLSEANLRTGRPDEAARLAIMVQERARERGERPNLIRALWLLGEHARLREPIEANAAETYYREAQSHATAVGMRPLVAHCHLGLGALYHHTGARAAADEHLAAAATLYREMGMDFWLARTEAVRADRPVKPSHATSPKEI